MTGDLLSGRFAAGSVWSRLVCLPHEPAGGDRGRSTRSDLVHEAGDHLSAARPHGPVAGGGDRLLPHEVHAEDQRVLHPRVFAEAGLGVGRDTGKWRSRRFLARSSSEGDCG